MKFKEWIAVLIFIAIAIMTTNFIGYHVSFNESLKGVLILCAITLVAVFLSKVIPLKLPMIVYCSILGLLLALPISPLSELVRESTGKLDFKAPLTIVGVLAGISIGASFHAFKKLGWRIVVVALLVMTSTYIGSVLIAQIVLKLTNAV